MEATLISGANLSEAWAKAYIECYKVTGAALSPCIVSFPVLENTSDMEMPAVRALLDKHLVDLKKYPEAQSMVLAVANTIFPESIWRLSKGNRDDFYSHYLSIFPRIMRCPTNRRGGGIYFERMIAYPSYKAEGDTSANQLEYIISTWNKGNHRHSAHQVGILNPLVDSTDARQKGFPCLQQIAFRASSGELSVNAFYANQTLEEKAYGNYLGLYRLGLFMANEMGLKLTKVSCIASVLKLNNGKPKQQSRELYEALNKALGNAS